MSETSGANDSDETGKEGQGLVRKDGFDVLTRLDTVWIHWFSTSV